MSSNPTIIGICDQQADRLEAEAKIWRAMGQAMMLAYSTKKLQPDEQLAIKELLYRAKRPVGADEHATVGAEP